MKQRVKQHNGLLVLNKPKGPSSARCLERIKHGLKQRKIGHAGTLDPMAQGVLLVLLGSGTKIAQYLVEGGKTYSGAFQLGVSTDTYDIEGEVTKKRPTDGVSEDDVRREVAYWREMTEQEVPPYSAAKHHGKPLYKIAREGGKAPEKTKTIRIPQAEVLSIDLPWVRFRVSCGAGTYIRSLVHSLGTRLECGATLTELTREYSHPFTLDQAHRLDTVLDDPDHLGQRVLPLSRALPHWPTLRLTTRQTEQVKNGVHLPASEAKSPVESGPELPPRTEEDLPGSRAMFLTPQGDSLALVEAGMRDGVMCWNILRGLWS